MDLVSKVERTIREERLIEEGDRIVVAVSGGPDSTALLHVLFLLSEKWRLDLAVAHVNHRFRGDESDREAEAVLDFANRLGLPCDIGVIDVPAYIERTGLNAQSAAREKRYAFLSETARKRGAGKIALAHHADDQAETVLMRLIRGAGITGLAGIPVRRTENGVELIRPLIRIYKRDLESYCRNLNLPVCRDSSNESRKYFRNRIRLDVMPFLTRYNPKLAEALNRLAETVRSEDDYMEAAAKRALEEIATLDADEVKFRRERFVALHVALQRRIIKLILNYLSTYGNKADFSAIETARSVILSESASNATLDIYEDLRLVREYDEIGFVRPKAAADYAYRIEQGASKLAIPEAQARLSLICLDAKNLDRHAMTHPDRLEAYFDADLIQYPLHVRNRRKGDRMEPFGLNGTKKVKDMFIDGKIPPSLRARIPHILDASGRILWIPGVRRSRHAPVSDRTSRVLYMKLHHDSGKGPESV